MLSIYKPLYLHNFQPNVQLNIMEQSFIAYIENSIKENWDLDALTDYKGATLQYKDVARKIEKLHIIFEASGIKKGDKIAVCGRNSSHWGVTFLATLTYGAVIVPILHEFKADNVHNIVNHSEAKLLFVGDQVWENLNESAMPLLEGIMMMADFYILVSRSEKLDYAREHLNEMFGKKYPKNFRKEHVSYHKDQPDELAVINYTSGTTSYSKGVMLPYRSLWSNTTFAFEVLPLKAGDKIVSMLPMAHMYGLAFEFLYEFAVGCHIFFLTRMPSPKIIFQAFTEVKPNLIVAVPLIIEKIIKKSVLPKLETPAMKLWRKLCRSHCRRSCLQPGSGAVLKDDRFPLYGRLWNDGMRPHHLLRGLDPLQTRFLRKGCTAYGGENPIIRSRQRRLAAHRRPCPDGCRRQRKHQGTQQEHAPWSERSEYLPGRDRRQTEQYAVCSRKHHRAAE